MIALETFMKELLLSTQCNNNECSGSIPFIIEIVSDNAHPPRRRIVKKIDEEKKHQQLQSQQQQRQAHAARKSHHHHRRLHRHRHHNSHEILMINDASTTSTTFCGYVMVDDDVHHHLESRWECICSGDFELCDRLPHHPVASSHNNCTTLDQRKIHHRNNKTNDVVMTKNKTTKDVVMKRSASDSRLTLLDLSFMAKSSTSSTTIHAAASKSFPGSSTTVVAAATTKSKCCCYDHFTEFSSSEYWNHLHHDSSSSSSPLSEPPKLPIRTVTPTRALTSLLVTHHDCRNGDELSSPTPSEMTNEEFASGDEIAGDRGVSSHKRTLMTIRSVLGVLAPGSSEQQDVFDENDDSSSPSPAAAEATAGEKRENSNVSLADADATLSSSMKEIIYHHQRYHNKDTANHRRHQYRQKQQELPKSLSGSPYDFDY